MTLCRGKFMRERYNQNTISEIQWYSDHTVKIFCISLVLPVATESLLDVHAWFYWLIGTCKLPMNLYCLPRTLLARAISWISISDVISSLIRCSVWCWRAWLTTKKCLESRLASGFIFLLLLFFFLLPSALITWSCMVSLSRPKPVLQSLEHDRHVNIKFTSILTRTNLNWRCLSRIVFLNSCLYLT